MTSIRWAYARVSTNGQELARQKALFLEAGIREEHIFLETWSSMDMRRTELTKLMGQVREGDSIVCTELSRASRSVKLLLEWVDTLGERGVVFETLSEGIHTDRSPRDWLTDPLTSLTVRPIYIPLSLEKKEKYGCSAALDLTARPLTNLDSRLTELPAGA